MFMFGCFSLFPRPGTKSWGWGEGMKCQGTACTWEKLAEFSEQEAEVIAWGGGGGMARGFPAADRDRVEVVMFSSPGSSPPL